MSITGYPPERMAGLLRGDSAIEAEIREGSGIDWFELNLGRMIDGERLDLVPPLIELITKSGPDELTRMRSQPQMVLHLRFRDGRYLALPGVRLRPFVETLTQLFAGAETKDGRIRFSVLDASQLARLDDLEGTVWTGDDWVRALGRKLSELGRIPDVALPETFRATLRPYQARGFAWLDLLRDAGLDGCRHDPDDGILRTPSAARHDFGQSVSERSGPAFVHFAPGSLSPAFSSVG